MDLLVAATAAMAAAHRLVAAVGMHPGGLAAIDVAEAGRLLRPVVDPRRWFWLAGRSVDLGRLGGRAVRGRPVGGVGTVGPVAGVRTVGAQIGRLAAAALQPIERALADVPRSRATRARPP